MSAAKLLAFDVLTGFRTVDVPPPAPRRHHVETARARALDRLLSATVDADRANGVELSLSKAGAREQALDVLAAVSRESEPGHNLRAVIEDALPFLDAVLSSLDIWGKGSSIPRKVLSERIDAIREALSHG